ncbi:hypothetical protein DFH09DRAFT_228409 [Mycena vulgaris]|nr:hypothetical protein DFH09DRAFT_1294210 [Mycena vulgaris]KAJ6518565.1 hypothetical protein DFH09DRAFT_228409 [Mycena vulgaris]
MLRTLTLSRRTQSLPPSRPQYPLSTAFGLTGTKGQRYQTVQLVITEAFITLNPLPDGLPANFDGHKLTRPKMNTGATRERNGGMWFQQCYNHPGCNQAYHPLTPPLDYDTLQLPWLQDLFAIRREVAPVKRVLKPVVVRRVRQRTSVDNLAPAHAVNDPPTQAIVARPGPAVVERQDRQQAITPVARITSPPREFAPLAPVRADITPALDTCPLDATVPVLFVGWAADLDTPEKLTLFPRITDQGRHYLCLDDFQALLKSRGFGPDLELYLQGYKTWIVLPFSHPIPISSEDAAVILRARGVNYLEDWPF